MDEVSFIDAGKKPLPPRGSAINNAGAACLRGPGGDVRSGYQFLTIVKPITRPMSDLMMS